MQMIEISGLIEPGMWSYGEEPGGPEKKVFGGPEITELATVEKDGYSAHRFDLSILTATYLETGAHILSGVRTIDQVPPEDLFLKAAVIKTDEKAPCGHIKLQELENSGVEVKKDDCLVVFTGWYEMWNKKGFVLDSPHFESAAMDWVVSKKIKILAGDVPCYDDMRNPEDAKILPQLRKLYLSGAMALAPVVNGDKVKAGRARIVVLPLKIKGVCATPARAIVIQE